MPSHLHGVNVIIRIYIRRFFKMSSLLPKGLLAAFASIAGLGLASTTGAFAASSGGTALHQSLSDVRAIDTPVSI